MPCMSASIVSSPVITHTGPLSSTTVYTPSSDGVYRMSATIQETANNYSVQLNFNGGAIFFTDMSGNIDPSNSHVYTFFQSAGSPVNLNVSTGSSTVQYTLYVVIEQLA